MSRSLFLVLTFGHLLAHILLFGPFLAAGLRWLFDALLSVVDAKLPIDAVGRIARSFL